MGSCGRGQSYHTDAPGHLAGCAQPVSGDVEAAKNNNSNNKF